MANRKVTRMGLSSACIERLGKSKPPMCTAKDVLSRTPYELVNMLDMDPISVNALFDTVCEKVCPPGRSVASLYDELKEMGGGFLPTGLTALDEVLHGGLPNGGIVEVVGPAGAGKSQEGRFSADRLMEIASHRLPRLHDSPDRVGRLIERCLVYRVHSTAELLACLGSLSENIIEHGVKLLVVDSVAALKRREFSNQALQERQSALVKEAQIMKQLAETFSIPVIVSNQVTTRYNKYANACKAAQQYAQEFSRDNFWELRIDQPAPAVFHDNAME